MESQPAVFQTEYPNFFGSRFEVFLRVLAFLLLITVAGKFIPLVDIVSLGETVRRHLVIVGFVWGNAALFLILLVWDIFAIVDQKRRGKICATPIAYILSDCIAFICWTLISVSVRKQEMPVWASIVIALVLLTYVGLMIIRLFFPGLLRRIEVATCAPKE